MKYIVLLSFDLEHPGELGDVLKKIDPPNIPGFTGIARVAVDPVASQIEEWIDE